MEAGLRTRRINRRVYYNNKSHGAVGKSAQICFKLWRNNGELLGAEGNVRTEVRTVCVSVCVSMDVS